MNVMTKENITGLLSRKAQIVLRADDFRISDLRDIAYEACRHEVVLTLIVGKVYSFQSILDIAGLGGKFLRLDLTGA